MTSALKFKDSRSQNVSGTLDCWVHTGEMNLPSAETEIEFQIWKTNLCFQERKRWGGGDKLGVEVDTAVYQISTGNHPQ